MRDECRLPEMKYTWIRSAIVEKQLAEGYANTELFFIDIHGYVVFSDVLINAISKIEVEFSGFFYKYK